MQREEYIKEILNLVKEFKEKEIVSIIEKNTPIRFNYIYTSGKYGISYKDIKINLNGFPLSIIRKVDNYKNLYFIISPKEKLIIYDTLSAANIHYTPKHVLMQILYLRERNLDEIKLKENILNDIYKKYKTKNNPLTSLLTK